MNSRDIQDVYELSPMQQGILFHLLYAPQSGAYNQQHTCVLHGPLNTDVFKRAWQHVVDRHPILRTSFHWKRVEKPVQVVQREAALDWDEADWSDVTPAAQAERVEGRLKACRHQGFDLSKAPLMQLSLIRLGEDRHQFIWNLPHLLIDGWSVPIVLKEVFIAYETMRRGVAVPLPTPRPYKHYIAWIRGQDLSEAERFWRGELKGLLGPTPLGPGWEFGKWPERDDTYARQDMRMSDRTIRGVTEMVRKHHLTWSTLFHGLWALLLAEYSGRREVVFGSVVSGRPVELPGAASMIGVFINTLPVRVTVDGGERILPWLERLQRRLAEMRQYEYTPLAQIQQWSDVPQGTPLFESILAFENYPNITLPSSAGQQAVQASSVQVVDRNNYPLSLVVEPSEDSLVWMAYNKEALDSRTIARLLDHLRAMLDRLAEGCDLTLERLVRMPPEEERRLLVEWNATGCEFPDAMAVHQMFEAQAGATPDRVAVEYAGEAVTYRELNRLANRVARHLERTGIGTEGLVGLCLERSIDLVAAMLGVLKAGAGYVPLDPGYPSERLAGMAEDAGLTVIVTTGPAARLSNYAGRIVDLGAAADTIAREDPANLERASDPDQVAYVIYTSGSTGRPKGVAVTHGALSNHMAWIREELGLDERARVLQKTAISFDASVWEFYAPLMTGGQLVLAKPGGQQDSRYLVELMRERDVNVAQFVPSMLDVLVEDEGLSSCGSLEHVCSGGEPLRTTLAARCAARVSASVHNLYGPTETCIDATAQTYGPGGTASTVPIGRPIANTQVYVVGADGEPVPTEVTGELWIGGAGVARGYVRQPAATAEKFTPDPFGAVPGRRVYRTGDMVRWLNSGTLEYAGRRDHQVKVRGHRIELGEIEALVRAQNGVRDAVVIAEPQENGEPRLVAFIVWHPGADGSTDQVRHALAEQAPEAMVPSAWVTLDALPLAPNGKLDRKALRAPAAEGTGRDRPFVPPGDSVEERLVGIWEELLTARPIGIRDSFFALGGHSLLALRLMIKVQKAFGVTVPLAALIRSQTIEQMAALVRGDARPVRSVLIPIQPGGSRPPLVCVHPGAGDVLCYSRLAASLGPEQPFFGIQDPGLAGAPIDEMARRYVAELIAHQPNGPYYLSGWSFGGVVAFEMAQQLARDGREVAFLGLLDCAPPAGNADEIPDDVFLTIIAREMSVLFGTRVYPTIHDLGAIEPPRRTAFVLEFLKGHGVLPPETEVTLLERLVGLFKARTRALQNYSPAAYPGTITLFRAVDRSPQRVRETADIDAARPDGGAAAWAALTSEPLIVHDVQGDHVTMLIDPHVQGLGELLRRSLESAPAASSWNAHV